MNIEFFIESLIFFIKYDKNFKGHFLWIKGHISQIEGHTSWIKNHIQPL